MSTRTTIKIYDQYEACHIYRHMDGYPRGESGVPATIQEACAYAWPLPRFEASDFAAALVRAWKGKGGGNIYLTNGHQCHVDTEYQYNLTAKDARLWIDVQEVGRGDGDEETRHRETLFEGWLDDAISHFRKLGEEDQPLPAVPTRIEEAAWLALQELQSWHESYPDDEGTAEAVSALREALNG